MASIRRRGDKYAVRLQRSADRAARVELTIGDSEPLAELACKQIGILDSYRAAGEPVPTEILAWVDRQDARVRVWLAKHRLIASDRAVGTEPIGALLAAFLKDQSTNSVKGRPIGAKRLHSLRQRIENMIDATKARCVQDLTSAKVRHALAQMQKRGKAAGTVWHFAQSLQQFTRWVAKAHQVTDPLSGLKAGDYKGEAANPRRAFNADELSHLITATATGPDRWHTTGADRAVAYLISVETGLRASELRSLKVGNFDLDADAPIVWCDGVHTKNGKRLELPLKKGTADILKSYFATKLKTASAFSLPWGALSKVFKRDLAEARVQWINAGATADERQTRDASDFLAAKDTQGRKATYHSLRHCTASLLATSGVHVSIAKDILRHSTVELTIGVYTHTQQSQLHAAVERMPEINTALATGTDGKPSYPPAYPNDAIERNSPQRTATLQFNADDQKPNATRETATPCNTTQDNATPRGPRLDIQPEGCSIDDADGAPETASALPKDPIGHRAWQKTTQPINRWTTSSPCASGAASSSNPRKSMAVSTASGTTARWASN
jgi:integrase